MILSLRDEALATQDCDNLRAFGVPALESPVHHAHKIAFDEMVVNKADGFILTSQQAAYALPDTARDRPVFTVGRASAAAARGRGYHNVFAGTADGTALAEMIAAHAEQGQISFTDSLIWLRATKISTDMMTALSPRFSALSQEVVYEMQEADSLPDEVLGALQKGQVSAIMVLSKAQLGALVQLLHHHNLWQVRHKIALYVVSQAVGLTAEKQGWHAIDIARRKRALSVQASVITHWYRTSAEGDSQGGCKRQK